MTSVLSDTGSEQKPFFVTLPGRGLIRIDGLDRHEFLQALVSNDLDRLMTSESVYACLLTPQGKYLFDFIIFKDDDTLVLDCEGGVRLHALAKKLSMYKLKMKIEINLIEKTEIYASINLPPDGDGHDYSDPRHDSMGRRSLEKPDAEERPFQVWDERRIRLGIPDGSRDMVPEQSTLIECRIDRLNGVSFEKGCYIGQELTARMHHRGLAKKHLYAIEWPEDAPPPGTDILIGGKTAGQTRSHCGQFGVASLRDEAIASGPLPFRILTP